MMTKPSTALQEAASPAVAPVEFEEFFRSAYQQLIRYVIFAGGNTHEAEDVVSAAMAEVFQRWESIENPLAYARRAAIRILFKDRNRELRIQERLIQSGQVPPEHDLDPGLMVWEQQERVTQLLNSLPTAQRGVLACTVDQFTISEISVMLGMTNMAARQNLARARSRLKALLGLNQPHLREAA